MRTSAWSEWDAESHGFVCEPGVGITVSSPHAGSECSSWLSWDETMALHAWLGRKLKAAGPAPDTDTQWR